MPFERRKAHQRIPGRRPVLGGKPGARGQRGDAEIGPGEIESGSQLAHPRISVPRTLGAFRLAVDGDDIGDVIATQREGQGQTTLAGADNQNIDDWRAGGVLARPHPRRLRVVQQVEVTRDLGFEVGKRNRHGRSLCHRSPETYKLLLYYRRLRLAPVPSFAGGR